MNYNNSHTVLKFNSEQTIFQSPSEDSFLKKNTTNYDSFENIEFNSQIFEGKQTKNNFNISLLTCQTVSLLTELIQKIVSQKIEGTLINIVNLVTTIREQVSAFTKEQRQEVQNESRRVKKQVKKLQRNAYSQSCFGFDKIFSKIQSTEQEFKIGLQIQEKIVMLEDQISEIDEKLSNDNLNLSLKIQNIKTRNKSMVKEMIYRQMDSFYSLEQIDRKVKMVIKNNIKMLVNEVSQCKVELVKINRKLLSTNID